MTKNGNETKPKRRGKDGKFINFAGPGRSKRQPLDLHEQLEKAKDKLLKEIADDDPAIRNPAVMSLTRLLRLETESRDSGGDGWKSIREVLEAFMISEPGQADEDQVVIKV